MRRIRANPHQSDVADVPSNNGAARRSRSRILSVAIFVAAAAILITAPPARAASDFAAGTTEVVIDTGAQFITTCVGDDVVAAAEDGEPVTLAVETCSCDYAAMLAPRRLRRYDDGDTPDCRNVGNGLRLVGSKAKPTGTQVTLLSGLAPTNGGKNCRITFVRGSRTVLDFQMAVTTPGMEEACRTSLDDYRAAVPNDEYAALTCPGFE